MSGTVANLPEGTAESAVVALSQLPDSGSWQDAVEYIVGQGEIGGNGEWSLKALSDAPASLWFAVFVYGEKGEYFERYFVTTAASSEATVQLDISAMQEVY